ncbi:MAG TPA: NAD(+) synthase [Terriglobia bacterium]|nr:NAD(+) synthase [Terriglobia bacterium]
MNISTPVTEALKLDAAAAVEEITGILRDQVQKDLKRRGAVVGLSGGIDSSVVAALSARALGKDKVLGLMMPERESSGESLSLGALVADSLGIPTLVEDITPMLDAAGCYRRRDEMVRRIVPEYGPGYRCKIVLPSLNGSTYRVFSTVVQAPDGREIRARLDLEAYLGIVAATNFKQRARKMMEYYHADRLNYAVMGTPNRLEYDQGFFVKNGDGAADAKPIAHLYKTQVYQLAEYLGIPETVRQRPPTTDTYPMSQSQEEFYFSLPYDQMDACLYGVNHGIPADHIAAITGVTAEQIEHVYRDIEYKRRATRYQHMKPLLIREILEVQQA